MTESTVSDTNKIKPFLEYKNEFSKIKQKKLNNAIKFANIISKGQMTFSEHSTFIKEGIRSFEGQTKRLEELKKEEEKEKEKIKSHNYDIIIGDYNEKDKILEDKEMTQENVNNKKMENENQIKEKFNNDDKNNNNNNIIKKNIIKKKLIFGNKKKVLGRKRSEKSYSLNHHLMMDLIYSIDDFIYNKRNMKINDYDLFFQDIELKIPKNKLNTNGLNVSI